jgi:hypothetical protein
MWRLTLGYNNAGVTCSSNYIKKIGAEACAMSSSGAFAFSNRPTGTELEKLHSVTCPPTTLKRSEMRIEPSERGIQRRRRARVQALR